MDHSIDGGSRGKPGEVGRQRKNLPAFLVCDLPVVFGAPAVELLLCVIEGAQPGVPFGFQHIVESGGGALCRRSRE